MNNVFMRWACLCLLGAGVTFSQYESNLPGAPASKAPPERTTFTSGVARTEKADGPAVPVEDSLFFLSPGNRFRLRWWGIGAGEEILLVNTRWEVVVPDRGVVSVRGRNFKQVRTSIDSMLRSQIRIKMIDLQLLDIGNAQVQVTGLLPNPGVIEVPAGERLTVVLGAAGLALRDWLRAQAGTPPARPGDRYQVPSLRHVQLVRGSGKDTIWCDLAKAYNAGEGEQDPRVFSGDQVRVFEQGPVVAVSGDVPFSGYVEVVPGESVGSFLKATGLTTKPAAITIMARDGVRRSVGMDDVLDTNALIVELPQVRRRSPAGLVWIAGYVKRSGGYPFHEGMTVRELLSLAGGDMSQSGDSSISIGVKRGWGWIQAGRRPGFENSFQYPELKQALQGYQHQMMGNYSDPDAALQVGDSVVVHQMEKVVWVGGLVKRPGYVPWKKGSSHGDYVEAAGGYADRAWEARVKIYDLYTQQIVPLNEPIRPGSALIVPERRYLYFDQWVMLGATVLSAVVSAMYFYVTVSK